MHLKRLPPASALERSEDERLADAITAHFLGGAPFPNEHGFALSHDAPPPTVYGRAWRLEPGEEWCAHVLGTVYYAVSETGEFHTAGAAAVLVTHRHLRLMLGAGGPGKPQGALARRGAPSEGTRLDHLVWRFNELSNLGAGDLLILHHWKLGRLVLRVPWARSIAALIAGLRAVERQPHALEDGVVTPRAQRRLEGTPEPKPTLEVKSRLEE
jgi:hypothetical protein